MRLTNLLLNYLVLVYVERKYCDLIGKNLTMAMTQHDIPRLVIAKMLSYYKESFNKFNNKTKRWVQVTPSVTLVKLHLFYTVDL